MFQDTKDTFSETQHTLGTIIILEVTAKNDFFHSPSKVLWFNHENKGGQYLLSFTSQLKTISNCLEKKNYLEAPYHSFSKLQAPVSYNQCKYCGNTMK